MKKTKGMNIFLGIGLAIILFGLINLGISAFYPSPDYIDFCNQSINTIPTSQASCESLNGTWYYGDATKPGTCDLYKTCSDKFYQAQSDYNSTLFYVLVIAGLAVSVFGFMYKLKKTFEITAIATGLSLIIEGIIRNYENKIPAFTAGALAFGILVYFINKKFK